MGATFLDKEGKSKSIIMGCYGIGITRTLAAAVEQHHDDKGMIWPEGIAPFQVHLISLSGGEENAQKAYDTLLGRGIEVLWDERDESAGVKFADCDLIGIPYRLVISKRTGGNIEVKRRNEKESNVIPLSDFLKKLEK